MKNILSRDNPTYKQLKKLAESARERRKAGQMLLDGVHLVEAYLAGGGLPQLLALSESGAHHPECAALTQSMPTVQTVMLADALFAEISPVETPVGILALAPLPLSAAVPDAQFCVLLEDIQDPGNLGSILRSAAAAGAEAIWLSAGCADAWSPKTLRAGMGAHFALQIEERVPLAERLAGFGGLSVAACLGAQQSLYALDLTGRVAFLIGNEGSGLSAKLLQAAGAQVIIPMPGRVESLNAAAAAAVCFFERVRQIRAPM